MTEEEMWKAVVNCDASYDNKFFYGVKTTGIYCLPSCKSKTPNRENIVFFVTKEEAEKAGFRPCKRCRPDLLDDNPAIGLSRKRKERIERDYMDRLKLAEDRKEIGVRQKHLTEVFKQQYGITPSEYRIQRKMETARKLLQEGRSIQEVSLLSGYKNLSEFYDHFRRQVGMTPARYREIFAKNIRRSVLDTPIGKLRIFASEEAILGVEKAEKENKEVGANLSSLPSDDILTEEDSGKLVEACREELKEYFSGKRKQFDLPLLPEGTDFQKDVWSHLKKIPYGEKRTYGELADSMNHSKAYRAVGMANHCNPILILIPCHRVIGADGSLTGYAAGVEAKKYLLELEKENAVK